MGEYSFLKQKTFESKRKFEKRLNDYCRKGWKPIALTGHYDIVTVLLEKVKEY